MSKMVEEELNKLAGKQDSREVVLEDNLKLTLKNSSTSSKDNDNESDIDTSSIESSGEADHYDEDENSENSIIKPESVDGDVEASDSHENSYEKINNGKHNGDDIGKDNKNKNENKIENDKINHSLNEKLNDIDNDNLSKAMDQNTSNHVKAIQEDNPAHKSIDTVDDNVKDNLINNLYDNVSNDMIDKGNDIMKTNTNVNLSSSMNMDRNVKDNTNVVVEKDNKISSEVLKKEILHTDKVAEEQTLGQDLTGGRKGQPSLDDPPDTEGTLSTSKKRGRRPKKLKNKRPKDMPTRPLSAYNYFFREERVKWLDEKPEVLEKSNELIPETGERKIKSQLFESMAREIARRWKELPDTVRQRFLDLANGDMQRYRSQMEAYQSKIILESGITLDANGKLPNIKKMKYNPINKKQRLNDLVDCHDDPDQVNSGQKRRGRPPKQLELINEATVANSVQSNDIEDDLGVRAAGNGNSSFQQILFSSMESQLPTKHKQIPSHSNRSTNDVSNIASASTLQPQQYVQQNRSPLSQQQHQPLQQSSNNKTISALGESGGGVGNTSITHHLGGRSVLVGNNITGSMNDEAMFGIAGVQGLLGNSNIAINYRNQFQQQMIQQHAMASGGSGGGNGGSEQRTQVPQVKASHSSQFGSLNDSTSDGFLQGHSSCASGDSVNGASRSLSSLGVSGASGTCVGGTSSMRHMHNHGGGMMNNHMVGQGVGIGGQIGGQVGSFDFTNLSDDQLRSLLEQQSQTTSGIGRDHNLASSFESLVGRSPTASGIVGPFGAQSSNFQELMNRQIFHQQYQQQMMQNQMPLDQSLRVGAGIGSMGGIASFGGMPSSMDQSNFQQLLSLQSQGIGNSGGFGCLQGLSYDASDRTSNGLSNSRHNSTLQGGVNGNYGGTSNLIDDTTVGASAPNGGVLGNNNYQLLQLLAAKQQQQHGQSTTGYSGSFSESLQNAPY